MSPVDGAEARLIAAVSRHFGDQDVDEGEALAAFSWRRRRSQLAEGPQP